MTTTPTFLSNYSTVHPITYSNPVDKSFDDLRDDLEHEEVGFTSFLETLLDSKSQLTRFLDGKTKRRFTFENLLSHPFFNDRDLEMADVLDLADNYDAVFNKK